LVLAVNKIMDPSLAVKWQSDCQNLHPGNILRNKKMPRLKIFG